MMFQLNSCNLRIFVSVIVLLFCLNGFGQINKTMTYNIVEYGKNLADNLPNNGISYSAIDIIIPIKNSEIYDCPIFAIKKPYDGYKHRLLVKPNTSSYIKIKAEGYDDLSFIIEGKYLVDKCICEIEIVLPDKDKYLLNSEVEKTSSSLKNVNPNDFDNQWFELDLLAPDGTYYYKTPMSAINRNKSNLNRKYYCVLLPERGASKTITFVCPGYYPYNLKVSSDFFQANSTYQLKLTSSNFQNSPELETYVINVNVPNFHLFIDGKEYYGEPSSYSRVVKLPPGKHLCEINKDEYFSEYFYISDYQTNVNLERKSYGISENNTKEKLKQYAHSSFFLGYSGCPKAPIGFNLGYLKRRSGFIAEVKASPTFLANRDVTFKLINDITDLSQVSFNHSEKLGAYTCSIQIGPFIRFSNIPRYSQSASFALFKLLAFTTVGYCKYSSLYRYDSKYFSPAVCDGLNCQLGLAIDFRKVLLTASYSRLISKPAYADINFGVSYIF